MNLFVLIAETADRIAVVLAVVAAAHVGAMVVEAAVICVGTTALRRTPEKGAAAGNAEATAVVEARRHSTETSSIIAARCVAHSTGVRTRIPACGGSQCLGNIGRVVTAQVITLAPYILG